MCVWGGGGGAEGGHTRVLKHNKRYFQFFSFLLLLFRLLGFLRPY